MKARSDCVRYITGGLVRLNRQPTDKPHSRLRVGDVLTLPVPDGRNGDIRVIRVLALAARRGPADEARGLYAENTEDCDLYGELAEGASSCATGSASCAAANSTAYPRD